MPEANQAGASPIVAAQLTDLEAIVAVMKQANQYALSKSGDLLWTTAHADNMLRVQLGRGDCFVIRNPDDTIAAMVAIDEEDIFSWDEQGSDGTALYFHKLMKNPQQSQPNSGIKLIHFVAQEAARRGKQVVRCDTKASMSSLITYYEKLGLIKQRDIIYKASKLPGVLLQGNSKEVLDKTARQLSMS